MSVFSSLSPEQYVKTEEKAALFCPTCDYQGSYSDEWGTTHSKNTLLLCCPQCETDITSQFQADVLRNFLK